ncbi:mediator of RNA polymerase II transcription subunit 15 [Scaptodrosophila lebanonensis]|uniref:Mediator of RNA polymerase II transcription subunit 15 n=1 Tax=Drosophila lebanonensis TaxID=7225 RepID=A0A6J2TYB4_DROLE|nr:mediator of RNA polymerase II transcription subunit 15 [Scaptodrosophila lebanonensis]
MCQQAHCAITIPTRIAALVVILNIANIALPTVDSQQSVAQMEAMVEKTRLQPNYINGVLSLKGSLLSGFVGKNAPGLYENSNQQQTSNKESFVCNNANPLQATSEVRQRSDSSESMAPGTNFNPLRKAMARLASLNYAQQPELMSQETQQVDPQQTPFEQKLQQMQQEVAPPSQAVPQQQQQSEPGLSRQYGSPLAMQTDRQANRYTQEFPPHFLFQPPFVPLGLFSKQDSQQQQQHQPRSQEQPTQEQLQLLKQLKDYFGQTQLPLFATNQQLEQQPQSQPQPQPQPQPQQQPQPQPQLPQDEGSLPPAALDVVQLAQTESPDDDDTDNGQCPAGSEDDESSTTIAPTTAPKLPSTSAPTRSSSTTRKTTKKPKEKSTTSRTTETDDEVVTPRVDVDNKASTTEKPRTKPTKSTTKKLPCCTKPAKRESSKGKANNDKPNVIHFSLSVGKEQSVPQSQAQPEQKVHGKTTFRHSRHASQPELRVCAIRTLLRYRNILGDLKDRRQQRYQRRKRRRRGKRTEKSPDTDQKKRHAFDRKQLLLAEAKIWPIKF